MNAARCTIAILAACLMLTACSRRADSDAVGTIQATTNASTKSQSLLEQERLIHAHLDGYGWVNRADGVVHIPIERAMDLIVAGKHSSGPVIDPAPIPEYRETNTAEQNKGRRLFVRYGCSACHDPNSPSHAPSLVGVFGQRVRLSDGTFVRADDRYLHDSIMLSSKQVVAGYGPVMPAYGSVIPEPDVRELIAYLKSTGPTATSATAARP